MNILKVLRTAFFYRTTSAAAFEVSFSTRKEFLKKKVSGEVVFTLISLFLVTRSTTTIEHLSFLQKLLNSIITKYSKQKKLMMTQEFA